MQQQSSPKQAEPAPGLKIMKAFLLRKKRDVKQRRGSGRPKRQRRQGGREGSQNFVYNSVNQATSTQSKTALQQVQPAKPAAEEKKQAIHIVNHIYTHHPQRLGKQRRQRDIEELSDGEIDRFVNCGKDVSASPPPATNFSAMSMSQIEDWFTGARNRSVRQSKLTSSSSTRNQKIASTSLSSDSTGDSMIDDDLMEKLDDFDYDPPKALGQGEQGIPNPSSTELSKKSISLQNQLSQSGQQTTKALDSHPSAASKTVVKETVTDKSALPGDKTSPKIAQSDGQSN